MEIVNANCATLSNMEVMKHLQKIKDSKKQNKGQLATITYETVKYLENTPCVKQTPETLHNAVKALAPFNLRKNEKLMLVNTPPTTALEIQLIVEESEERLSEDQVKEILKLMATHFPHIQKEEDGPIEAE